MNKSATLHYRNLVFIPRDCDITPNKKFPPTRNPPKNSRTATVNGWFQFEGLAVTDDNGFGTMHRVYSTAMRNYFERL